MSIRPIIHGTGENRLVQEGKMLEMMLKRRFRKSFGLCDLNKKALTHPKNQHYSVKSNSISPKLLIELNQLIYARVV